MKMQFSTGKATARLSVNAVDDEYRAQWSVVVGAVEGAGVESAPSEYEAIQKAGHAIARWCRQTIPAIAKDSTHAAAEVCSWAIKIEQDAAKRESGEDVVRWGAGRYGKEKRESCGVS